MAISKYNIKKWTKMLLGKSVAHVNQNMGRHFSISDISGYYNNLIEKVTKQPALLNTDQLPLVPDGKGGLCVFPVAIFQYGLGAYDLYLETQELVYKKKFFECCQWAIQNQQMNGAWDNFSDFYPDNPYGAMCQGEGASLLLRAYKETGEDIYISSSKKSIDFMLLSLEEGGTTKYEGQDVFFLEYTHLPIVLNGWIFAWWGLYDYVKCTNDHGSYYCLMEKSCDTIIKYLPQFSLNYWSKYELGDKITSPFYHRLHIAQMQAMHEITRKSVFDIYARKWEKQLNSPFCKLFAFMIKAFQKIRE